MENQIPNDDIDDILELKNKITKIIYLILEDQPYSIAITSLINAFIDIISIQCDTIDHQIFYRNLVIKLLDLSIEHRIKREKLKG